MASALDQSLPTILNGDGDEVVFCRVRFPLRSEGAAEIRERLRTIPAFQEENGGFWNWIERQPAQRKSSGKPASRSASKEGRSVRVTLDTGETILGNIELTDKALVLEANSRERAERGMAILADLAGALVGPVLTEIETLEQAMARRDGDVHQDKASDLPAELQAELVHEALTAHYRKALDEPIPALGDLSPRAAAKTAVGRRKVVDWLKHIENQSKSGRQPDDPMVSYDFAWLWRDLGLEKLRR
ncbi:hypothetical protein FHR70_004432 [Microvirga lupini]|uniref:DUF2384 domain-containing protein n=1 Tax=Microvirga lupini TaxID=420324 RepID=A0A7W4YYN8_9HYPH|nr:hypothetical protein [Microvirga lupini]MBB3021336.1 hypothetical protein [Microvirga lupini]